MVHIPGRHVGQNAAQQAHVAAKRRRDLASIDERLRVHVGRELLVAHVRPEGGMLVDDRLGLRRVEAMRVRREVVEQRDQQRIVERDVHLGLRHVVVPEQEANRRAARQAGRRHEAREARAREQGRRTHEARDGVLRRAVPELETRADRHGAGPRRLLFRLDVEIPQRQQRDRVPYEAALRAPVRRAHASEPVRRQARPQGRGAPQEAVEAVAEAERGPLVGRVVHEFVDVCAVIARPAHALRQRGRRHKDDPVQLELREQLQRIARIAA